MWMVFSAIIAKICTSSFLKNKTKQCATNMSKIWLLRFFVVVATVRFVLSILHLQTLLYQNGVVAIFFSCIYGCHFEFKNSLFKQIFDKKSTKVNDLFTFWLITPAVTKHRTYSKLYTGFLHLPDD